MELYAQARSTPMRRGRNRKGAGPSVAPRHDPAGEPAQVAAEDAQGSGWPGWEGPRA